jgi:hypothetical protein
MSIRLPRLLLSSGILAMSAAGQEWTDQRLVEATPGFQSEAFEVRLQQVGKLMPDRADLFSALVARIHGDHREYLLKVERLLEELSDTQWQTREDAERILIEVGGRARDLIQQRKEDFVVLEQHIRCSRILDALSAKGMEQEEREKKLLRGLVTTAIYLDSDPRLLRALRSALGFTDPSIVDGAIRALGKLGGDEEAAAVQQMLDWKGGLHRVAAASALGRMVSERAATACRALLTEGKLPRTAAIAMVRALQSRDDDGARRLLAELAAGADSVTAMAARTAASPGKTTVTAKWTLPGRRQVDGTFVGILGDSLLVGGAFEGLPVTELAFSDCEAIDFPNHDPTPATTPRAFLNQGSLVTGDLVSIDATSVRLRSPLFGELTLPRAEVQGLALDPAIDRLVGASLTHDRLRLASGEFVDGELLRTDGAALVVAVEGTGERQIARTEVTGILLRRPQQAEADTTTYTRVDLVTGERLIGFVVDASADQIVFCAPRMGPVAIPLPQVARIELGVGGGALWGFTLIADYSDNRIMEVDDQGRVVFMLEEVFGAWDAECLDNGNLLITEFSISRVQEVDRKGKAVWVFEDLKNPYDADRLPNGNTLIADTFGSRVIEVDAKGEIVWSYAKEIRPFDCERLANGNTLIADIIKDRVIEVASDGQIVWEAKSLPNVHDADRLPNGNTLVTLRNKGVVLEIDREGKTVWELTGLSSPCDADRLPNGHTLVAENTRVREFDRRGTETWRKEMTWAVEVNRY